MPETINENTTAYLTVYFRDKDGELAVPTSSRYRIDCMATGTLLVDWTNLGTVSSVEITIPSTVNIISNENNQYEDKKVTVHATYGEGDDVYEEYVYVVKNMMNV